MGVWDWWTKEGIEINQKVRSEFERTGDMVDRVRRIVAHDERIVSKRESAVRAQFVQTAYTSPFAVVISDDEHEGFLLH